MKTPLPAIDNCNDCGACCTAQEALPVGWYLGVLRGRRHGLPAELLAELEAFAERFNAHGWPSNGEPCVWYDADTRRCKHYEHRPDVCRDGVKPGDDACREWRKVRGIDPTNTYRLERGRLIRV